MRLNIILKNNQSARNLFETIKSHWEEATVEDFFIKDEDYLYIRFGTEQSKIERTLNSITAIERSADFDNIAGIMKLNHVNCGETDPRSSKIYEVLVFDMKILYIRQKVPGKSGFRVKYLRENQKTRVVEMARKTLLLSGLDLAMITLEINSKKRLMVTGIESSPDLKEKDISNLIEELDKLYNMKPKDIKLGADPEFMIINNRTGKLVSASHFFPTQGIVGCDNIRLPNRQQRPIAELRPKASKSPLQLVTNLKYALTRASSMAPYTNVKWVAGSQPVPGYSIGGHIHFSNLELNAASLRALDNYVGLIIFLIEKPLTAAKRRKKYGMLSEYREKNYGGFEYRTPGSWLMSQKIATAVICLSKIVASNYLQLQNNYLNLAAAHEAFYSGNREYFLQHFNNIWDELTKTDLYLQYAEEIEVLRWMINNDIQWDEKMDIRKGWKLTTGSKKTSSRNALENSRQLGTSSSSTGRTATRSPIRRNTMERRSSNRSRSTSRSAAGSSRRRPGVSTINRSSVQVYSNNSMPSGPRGRIVVARDNRRAAMIYY